MSDRLTAANGKRNQAWGTHEACPECGECLCYGCHPSGPCVDDRAPRAVVIPARPMLVATRSAA